MAVLGLLFSCKKEDGGSTMTAMEVKMTDAPGDYNQVNVDLQQVTIKMKNGGWINVQTNQGVYDLLKLQNGIDTTVVVDSVPTGDIEQIRFILGPNNTIMVDSTLYPLATPSAMQSGLKLNLNKFLLPNFNNVILIDFDAHESIVEQGNGDYSLKPVLRTL